MKRILIILIGLCIALSSTSQTPMVWSQNDRQYLLENLIRSKDQLIKETQNLTKEQWNFKESPDRWSISQVVEHISFFEMMWQRETVTALASEPIKESENFKPDSFYVNFIMEAKPHITTEYTKPFTYTVPMGLNEGKNNLAWFVKMRNESIDFIRNATQDLRAYSLKAGRPNLHQLYIYVFGHTDRHLRQILKIKQHPNYPK